MSAAQRAILPREFAAVLRRLRGDELNAVLRKAYQEGWQQTVLAGELGVSRQAVSRRIGKASYGPATATTVEVPEP